MRKNLYWLIMVLLVLSCIRSGCGGSGGGDVTIGGNNGTTQKQQQNNTPNVPGNPTSPDNPTVPNNPTSPDNPAIPDNPTSQDNPSAEFNMNGTWRVESGQVSEDNISFPELSHTSRYIEGTAPSFDISVSKNSGNEYYTVKLSGENVIEEQKGDFTVWAIQVGNGESDNPRVTNVYFLLRGINTFRHPEANYYVCDDTDIMSTVGSTEDFNVECAEASYSFRAVDKDTVIVHSTGHNFTTYLPSGITTETYDEMTMNLKRVK